MRFVALSILIMTLLSSACNRSPELTISTSEALPHSMKGFELYSWPVDEEWHFTLITGTNRLKTVEEITTGEDVIDAGGWVRISVVGMDALKGALGRLPAGEPVFWVGGWYLFFDRLSLPPQAIIDEVQVFCQDLGLELSVVE
jgi:hypothetical protein